MTRGPHQRVAVLYEVTIHIDTLLTAEKGAMLRMSTQPVSLPPAARPSQWEYETVDAHELNKMARVGRLC